MYNSKMLQAVFVNSLISFQNIAEMRLEYNWRFITDKSIISAEIYQCKFIFLHFDILNRLNVDNQLIQDFKKCFEFLASKILNNEIDVEFFTFVLHLFSILAAQIVCKHTDLKNTQRSAKSIQECLNYINNSEYKIFYLDVVGRIEQSQIFSWYTLM